MAPRPTAINTAFCRSNVHAQFGVTGVSKTLARRLVNKRSFVALVPNDTTCVECKHLNSFASGYHSVPGQRTKFLHGANSVRRRFYYEVGQTPTRHWWRLWMDRISKYSPHRLTSNFRMSHIGMCSIAVSKYTSTRSVSLTTLNYTRVNSQIYTCATVHYIYQS